MKLSGFGDYGRRARWSELPAGCFNNRDKFNIDERRINNSRITSGGDAFARPLSSTWKKPARGGARLRGFRESSLARETLFITIFRQKPFRNAVKRRCNLSPPSLALSLVPFFSPSFFVVNCRRLRFRYLSEIRMWRFWLQYYLSAWMKPDWILAKITIKDNAWRWYEYEIFIILSSDNSHFGNVNFGQFSTKSYFQKKNIFQMLAYEWICLDAVSDIWRVTHCLPRVWRWKLLCYKLHPYPEFKDRYFATAE